MSHQARHRTEEEIVADILAVIHNNVKKTRIMYGANLSYALTIKYLNRLTTCGLVRCSDDNKGYILTDAGKDYLEKFAEYKSHEQKLALHNSLFEEKRDVLIKMLYTEAEEQL